MGAPTVFGAELSLGLTEKIPGQTDPEATHLLVLARGVEGYRGLSAAITEANLRGEKNRPVFDLEDLGARSADWMILTGRRKGTAAPGAERPRRRPERPAPAHRTLRRRLLAVELSRDGTPGRRREAAPPRRTGISDGPADDGERQRPLRDPGALAFGTGARLHPLPASPRRPRRLAADDRGAPHPLRGGDGRTLPRRVA